MNCRYRQADACTLGMYPGTVSVKTCERCVSLKQNTPHFAEHREQILAEGPGTELKKLLARFGIVKTSNCQCDAHARLMNEMGPQWCSQNLPTIVGWMSQQAATRKLPFSPTAATLLVRLAIARAKKSLTPVAR